MSSSLIIPEERSSVPQSLRINTRTKSKPARSGFTKNPRLVNLGSSKKTKSEKKSSKQSGPVNAANISADINLFFNMRFNNADVGRDISQIIAKTNTKNQTMTTILQSPEMYVSRWLPRNVWHDLLMHYECNQTYISLQYSSITPELVEMISTLESWFMRVIEPPPDRPFLPATSQSIAKWKSSMEDWWNRESSKYQRYTWYCRHGLRSMAMVPDIIVINVKSLHDRILSDYGWSPM